jgi:hypothetical protein
MSSFLSAAADNFTMSLERLRYNSHDLVVRRVDGVIASLLSNPGISPVMLVELQSTTKLGLITYKTGMHLSCFCVIIQTWLPLTA